MRLIDTLAADRILYARPTPTLPDIMLLDVPAALAGNQLPLGRYYPILLETGQEASELTAYLTKEREEMIAPTLFDRRSSALATTRITLARYAPPAPDWPWILLCHWPADLTLLASDPDSFARQAYTIEMFTTDEALAEFSQVMLTTLGKGGATEATLILPGAIAGSA
jgi:hypothetical protein